VYNGWGVNLTDHRHLVPNFTFVELYLHCCMHRDALSSVLFKYRVVMWLRIKWKLQRICKWL